MYSLVIPRQTLECISWFWVEPGYIRGDSMILAFHGTPLARGLGLCVIDRVHSIASSNSEKFQNDGEIDL